MSPRIDHRPPFIAFVFLVVLAIAVVGTSARALDGTIFRAGNVGIRIHASGSAAVDAAAARVVPVNPTGRHTRSPAADIPAADTAARSPRERTLRKLRHRKIRAHGPVSSPASRRWQTLAGEDDQKGARWLRTRPH